MVRVRVGELVVMQVVVVVVAACLLSTRAHCAMHPGLAALDRRRGEQVRGLWRARLWLCLVQHHIEERAFVMWLRWLYAPY